MKKIVLSTVVFLCIAFVASAQENKVKAEETEQSVKAKQEREKMLKKEEEKKKREAAVAEKNLIKETPAEISASAESNEAQRSTLLPKEKQEEVKNPADSKKTGLEAKSEEAAVPEKRKVEKKAAAKSKKK